MLGAVAAFQGSAVLAGAYGITETLTMMITTLLTWFVLRAVWRLTVSIAGGVTLFLLALDTLLVAGCIIKFFDEGRFLLVIGALLFLAMSTWSQGRARLVAIEKRDGVPLLPFLAGQSLADCRAVARTAVFLVTETSTVPGGLLHNITHNLVLHACNAIVHVRLHEEPWIVAAQRVDTAPLGYGFWQVTLYFGFMETPDVPQAWGLCDAPGLDLAPMRTSYFLSRATLVPAQAGGIAGWRPKMFAAMMRDSPSQAARFFRLPDNAVIELGARCGSEPEASRDACARPIPRFGCRCAAVIFRTMC